MGLVSWVGSWASAGRTGIPVYAHRLRHTCATQLLNAGCRITSIQKFLGHKRLNTTLVYARANDRTVADDYYTVMTSVENDWNWLKSRKDWLKVSSQVKGNNC